MDHKLNRVEKIIAFIEKLIVPSGKGEGKPLKLRPFQRKFIHDVYSGDVRIVRTAILSIARKNGKTALIAALVLVHLVGPESVRNGEIYSAATERKQAAITFKYAHQFVEANAELRTMIKVVDSTKRMVCYKNGSVYEAISAEAGSKFGYNPTVVIYDELAQAKNTDLYNALSTSMAAREEPLFLIISTQSADPQHILSQLIDDGLSAKDPTTVCHLYEVPIEQENIFNSKRVWLMANPAIGDFRSLQEMKVAAAKAKRLPSTESAFRNFYLNQRVDAKAPLIPRAEWMACKGEYEVEKGSKIYLGLDLSGKNDLTALVGISDGDKDKMMSWFFKPGDTIKEHCKRDRVPYDVWVKKKFIETSPGRAIQYEWIAQRIAQIDRDYNIVGIAFDRWHIEYLLQAMKNIEVEAYVDGKEEINTTGIRMFNWGQGFKDMSPAIEGLETSILSHKLVHDGNPVMTWNISNAIAVPDSAGNKKLDKSKSRFRIDGAVALTMAIGLKSRFMAKEPVRSKYEGMSRDKVISMVNLI